MTVVSLMVKYRISTKFQNDYDLLIEFFLPEMGDRRKTIETDIIAPRLLCVTFKF